MADHTSISWTDATWNPVRGCSRVSPGCDNCYAMQVAYRFKGEGQPYDGLATLRRGKADWTGYTREVPEHLADPLRWRRPRRIFVNSMSDLFHETIPFDFVAAVFGVMAAAPQHTFQVLTKRPKRARQFFSWAFNQRCHGNTTTEIMRSHAIHAGNFRAADGSMPKGPGRALLGFDTRWPLPNVWLGVSTENQKTADERIPWLLQLPAAVRFISAEPLLAELDVTPYLHRSRNKVCPECFYGTNTAETICPNDSTPLGPDVALDWVIVGGESGRAARPCDAAWIQSLISQCRAANVAMFVKQFGAVAFDSREAGRDSDEPHPGGAAMDPDCRLNFVDPKGSDPSEWGPLYQLQEFPR